MAEVPEAGKRKTSRGDASTGYVMGGPYDGVEVRPGGKRRGLFAWVSEDGRLYDKPRSGRYLHRAELWRYGGKKRLAWLYAEALWMLCEGCGAFARRAEGGAEKPLCPLCGHD